jgi:predicted Zn-dependent peptidase
MRPVVLLFTLAFLQFSGHHALCAGDEAMAERREWELKNGLHAIVARMNPPPLYSEALLIVRAGTGTLAPQNMEVAHIAAQAFLAGTRPPRAQSVRRELASLGASVEHAVGRDVIVFRFVAPSRNIAPFLRVVAELVNRPEPTRAEWLAAMAARQLARADEEADTWQRASRELVGLLWREPGSTPSSQQRGVQGLNQLAQFWRDAFGLHGMVFAAWGDLSVSTLADVVEQHLAISEDTGGRSAGMSVQPTRTTRPGLSCLVAPRAYPAALLVGLAAELGPREDFYAWQLLAHVLAASHSARLQQRLRTEAAMVYTVDASVIPIGMRGIILRVATQTERIADARAIILDEIERLRSEAVTDDELRIAQAILLSRLKLDRIATRERFYQRSLELLSISGQRDSSDAERIISRLSPAGLLEFARRVVDPEQVATVIVSEQPDASCKASP